MEFTLNIEDLPYTPTAEHVAQESVLFDYEEMIETTELFQQIEQT